MQARNEAWFNEIYRTYAPAVLRYLARRAAPDDVEDLAAEVFATCWRRRQDVPAEAELPWLYRTAGLILANFRRKKQAIPVDEDTGLLESADFFTPETAAIQDSAVRRALEQLSPRDRHILVLHAWEGLQGEALAQALGLSRGGADAALSRARSRLAAVWDP